MGVCLEEREREGEGTGQDYYTILWDVTSPTLMISIATTDNCCYVLFKEMGGWQRGCRSWH